MSQETGKIIQWNSASFVDVILYGISCFFLLPFHILLYPFTYCGFSPSKTEEEPNICLNFIYELGLHFTYPVNRFVGEFISYICFLILCFIASYLDLEVRNNKLIRCDKDDENNEVELAEFPINWADWLILIMSIGYIARTLWTIFKYIIDSWVFNKRYDITVKFWTYFHLIASSLIAVSVLIKIGAHPYFHGKTCDLEKEDRKYHNRLLQCIFCFLGVGLFLVIVRIFFFFSLHRRLGPISLIIKRVAKVCKRGRINF